MMSQQFHDELQPCRIPSFANMATEAMLTKKATTT